MYQVNILLNVFDNTTGIWSDKDGSVDVWVQENEVLIRTFITHDGLVQFTDIKDYQKSNLWFLNLIFKAELIEDY